MTSIKSTVFFHQRLFEIWLISVYSDQLLVQINSVF